MSIRIFFFVHLPNVLRLKIDRHHSHIPTGKYREAAKPRNGEYRSPGLPTCCTWVRVRRVKLTRCAYWTIVCVNGVVTSRLGRINFGGRPTQRTIKMPERVTREKRDGTKQRRRWWRRTSIRRRRRRRRRYYGISSVQPVGPRCTCSPYDRLLRNEAIPVQRTVDDFQQQ